MKQLHVWVTDEQFKELDKYPNKTERVRNAIDLYNEHITTDTVDGLRRSYEILLKRMDKRFDFYDEKFERMDKLISMLETRM